MSEFIRRISGAKGSGPKDSVTYSIHSIVKVVIPTKAVLGLAVSAVLFEAYLIQLPPIQVSWLWSTLLGLFIAVGLSFSTMMLFHPKSFKSTFAKIFLHPFSMTDLIEISLTTGTVTASMYEIGMIYLSLALNLVLCFFCALVFVEAYVYRNIINANKIFFYSLIGASSSWLLTQVLMMVAMIHSMPYTFNEYRKLWWSGFVSAVCTAGTMAHICQKN